jgi:hypothetical protein
MADDPRSEFERIFGATQQAGEIKPEDGAVRGATQRLPGDSDVLGIRTDSDRFLLKHVPERLPIEPRKDGMPAPKSDVTSPEAMTIALNVNVFANLADAKGGDGKSGTGISADGPTFVIPLPKPSAKPASEGSPSSAANVEKTTSGAQTEFTRILHVQDTITVPKPSSQPKLSEAAPAASAPAPALASSPSGPSDFTKVVKGSELRAIQARYAAGTNAAPHPGAPQQWQPGSAPPVPQYVPADWATPHPAPHANAPAHPQSKLSQYMPLIIALNVLFVLAILLIVFFAVKK